MSDLGTSTDQLLQRLEGIGLRKSKPDAARVERSLRGIYEALGKPFPEFRWVLSAETAALEPLQAGVDRFRAAGAPRTAGFHFHALTEAVAAAAGTGPMKAAWQNAAEPFGMRCGNEPRDFQAKIMRLQSEARAKVEKLLKRDKLDRLLETEFHSAAKTVVKKAGALFLPEERKLAAKDLTNSVLGSTFSSTRELAHTIQELPEWEFRGHDLSRQRGLLLQLIDAVDAGLWCFWPGPSAVVAVPRP